jgi:cell division protein FtsW
LTAHATRQQVSLRGRSLRFYFLLGITAFLLVFGLAMVASASAADAVRVGDSAAGVFLRQGLVALVGLGIGFLAYLLPLKSIKLLAIPALFATLGLQVATVAFGVTINGNQNWLNLGPIGNVQPSEFLKLGLILGISMLLTRLGSDHFQNRRTWLYISAAAGFGLLLVAVAGRDLGTGIVMIFIVLGMLFLGGMSLTKLLGVTAALGILAVLVMQTSASRRARLNAWLFPDAADPMGINWQYQHGTWALAEGGLFGVGPGRSKLKWSWIPEVENDFIFAIIGEEWGFIGALLIILIFMALALNLFVIARDQTDLFARSVVSGVMLWIVVQAFINIAVVLGLLPVLGVPLPLISAGGSSLLATLAALGLVLGIERQRTSRR